LSQGTVNVQAVVAGNCVSRKPRGREAPYKEPMGECRKQADGFFGADYIEQVTVGQAKEFRAYLNAHCQLSENTIRCMIPRFAPNCKQ
jgi:hypothetical protein